MKLIVNLSMLGERPTGLGVYSNNCLGRLSSLMKLEYIGNQHINLLGDTIITSPESISIGRGKLAAIKRFIWSKKLKLPNDILIYSPTHHSLNGSQKQIVTIHDLICLRFPRQHFPQYLYFKYIMPGILNKCAAVFTVSNTTKIDIHKYYKYPLNKIFVVPNSVRASDFTLDKSEPPRLDTPFLLMVGARYSHKNVDEVLDMHELWANKFNLVVTSVGGTYKDHLLDKIKRLGIQDKVRFSEYLTFQDLVILYNNATALLYPSKWEGFGIPPLEAIASGCRVILSDIPVHREIFEGACDFVVLGKPESWSDAFDGLNLPMNNSMVNARANILMKYTPENAGDTLLRSLLLVEPNLVKQVRKTLEH